MKRLWMTLGGAALAGSLALATAPASAWWGSGWGGGPWYGGPWYGGYPYYGGWGSGASTTYVNQWDEGTLIVDLIQNEIGDDDDFLVWRGAASGAVGETRRSPTESQAFIDGILANMFVSYPPKQ